MFKILEWLDHVTNPGNTYVITGNDDGSVTLTRAGEIIQQGTNLSAENFNRLEAGVLDNDLAAHIILLLLRNVEDRVTANADTASEISETVAANQADVLAEVTPEEQTITLTNTASYPFNDSVTSVSIAATRKTKNYTVEAEVSDSDGNVGEIEITDKALNGFKIAYTGSAAKTTITIKIRGGMLA